MDTWKSKVNELKRLQAETPVNRNTGRAAVNKTGRAAVDHTGQAAVDHTGQAAAELDALLPAILDRSFKGGL